MNLEELKRSIEEGTISSAPLVLVYKNTGRIVCEQYIDEISRIRKLSKVYCGQENLSSQDYGIADLLGLSETDKSLYIIFADEITTKDKLKDNHIICCKKVSDDIKDSFNGIVDVPELEQWHFNSYASGVLGGLSEDRINWLCSICKDKFRLMSEIDRLKLFEGKELNDLFDCLVDEGFFDDIVETNIFELSTAIQKKDAKAVKNVLDTMNTLTLNPIALNNILYGSFKDIMAIKLSPVSSPQALDIPQKKFNALKYYVNYFTKEQLLKILKLLSNTDYRIKTGQLPTNILLDYLITNILAI